MRKWIDLISRLSALAVVVALLGGCAAAGVAISKKDLDVQTKTSTAVFIDPVAKNIRTVYMDVRSGVQEFDRRSFTNYLRKEFAANENGYRLVDEPEAAQFHLSIYVLNLEKASPSAAQAALQQGYSSRGQETAAGTAAGALIGLSNTNSGRGMASGALLGGLVVAGGSLIADSLVKDVTYLLVADVSIKERVASGVLVRKDTAITAQVSNAGTSRQTVSEASDRKEYRTRVVTTANKVNLKIEEAQDLMFSKTAYALAGFF